MSHRFGFEDQIKRNIGKTGAKVLMFQRDIHRRREGKLESEYPRPILITLPFRMKHLIYKPV